MHIISDIKTKNTKVLTDMSAASKAFEKIILEAGAQHLGKVEHSFEESQGYTITICLAESHVAVHTWPELERVTVDVYLCNYLNDNTSKCEAIFQGILAHYDARSHNTTRLMR